jgi:hypothetical protein
LAWGRKATGRWYEPAIAADGTIYAVDDAVGVMALTSAGSWKWTARLQVQPVTATMVAIRSDGTVYVTWGDAANGAVLYAVSPDGAMAWAAPLSGVPAGIEVASDGTVEALSVEPLSERVVLNSIDSAGASLASFGITGLGSVVSAPALGPGGDLVSVSNALVGGTPVIAAITPGGTIDWSAPASGLETYPYGNEILWPIVRDDGTVLFGDRGGVRAFAPQGSMLWQLTNTGGMLAAAADGTVYAASQSSPNQVVAIRTDGTIGWTYGAAASVPVIVDGHGTIYAGTPTGMVAIGSDGTKLWETTAAAMPVAIDGAGTLYALDASGSTLLALR